MTERPSQKGDNGKEPWLDMTFQKVSGLDCLVVTDKVEGAKKAYPVTTIDSFHYEEDPPAKGK